MTHGEKATFEMAPDGKYTVRGATDTLKMGGTSTLTIAPRICGVCREPMPNSPMEFRTAHDACLQCPECQSDFVVWKTDSPAILRCLNCLHRWEGKP